MKQTVVFFKTKGVRQTDVAKVVLTQGVFRTLQENEDYNVVTCSVRTDFHDIGSYIFTDVPLGENNTIIFVGCAYQENLIATMMFYADKGFNVKIVPELFYSPRDEQNTCEQICSLLFGEESILHLKDISN